MVWGNCWDPIWTPCAVQPDSPLTLPFPNDYCSNLQSSIFKTILLSLVACVVRNPMSNQLENANSCTACRWNTPSGAYIYSQPAVAVQLTRIYNNSRLLLILEILGNSVVLYYYSNTTITLMVLVITLEQVDIRGNFTPYMRGCQLYCYCFYSYC